MPGHERSGDLPRSAAGERADPRLRARLARAREPPAAPGADAERAPRDPAASSAARRCATGNTKRGGHAARQGPRPRGRPPGRRGGGGGRRSRPSAEAWEDWHRVPWEERAAVFLRAAELLAGPWRDTLNAATMLGQSKTAHQAEIDAACELIDFWRFNPCVHDADLRGAAGLEPGRLEPPGVPAARGLRLRRLARSTSPRSAATSRARPRSWATPSLWKPASTAMLSAYYTMRIFQEAGLPDGVINLVYGSGKDIGDPALASRDLAGVHFTGSTAVFQGMWKTIGENIANYRSYPRIVGETGGKDFIVAHPTADAEAVATAILRGSFEYQGQKCSAASRVYAPASMWPAHPGAARLAGRRAQVRRRLRLLELHGRRHRRQLVRDAEGGDRGGQGGREERGRRRRRLRRQRGLLRPADGDPHRGSRLPAPPRRALRPGGHRPTSTPTEAGRRPSS